MRIERETNREVTTLFMMNLLLRVMDIREFIEGMVIFSSVEELNRLFEMEYKREDYTTLVIRLFQQGVTLAIVPDEDLGEDGIFWLGEDELEDFFDECNQPENE